jgi:hypothetical protein
MKKQKIQHSSADEIFESTERRQKPRLEDPIQLRVRVMQHGAPLIEFDTVALNISAGGICALAPCRIDAGSRLYLNIRFALPGTTPIEAPAIAAGGVVLRAREWPDGHSLFAAEFTARSLF